MCEDKIAKKKGYFEEAEEAIREYLLSTSIMKKNQLFKEIIDPALKKLVRGVMRMPKFQKIIGMPLDELEEDAYYHALFQFGKFDINRLGKDGKPVKAFSYFGTCVKNFVLQRKMAADKKIAKHGGTKDISEIKTDISQPDFDIKEFEEFKSQIIVVLKNLTSKYKLTKNDILVNNTLLYMLTNWHQIDFQDKNEFMRLLIGYTHLSSSVISTSLKKIKCLVAQNVDNINITKKTKKTLYLYETPEEEEEFLI